MLLFTLLTAALAQQAVLADDQTPAPVTYQPPTGYSNYTVQQVPYPLNTTHWHSEAWTKAHRHARARLANWTIEQKVTLATGVGWQQGKCVGNIGAVEEQGFDGLCLQDSPTGVRLADLVSAFPAGINVASTFDKDLMYKRSYAMGEEFKGKGVHVALAPMTNLGRVAAGGRNWEGFGADPYLAGWATEQSVRGLQDAGVQATVKHYIGNEEERYRFTSSSNIDDRTMRELYSHPFLRAVAADVASVMCSYNLLNSTWSCQNPETLNGILKTDFGFPGYVMSDWGATHSGVSAINAGQDMDMPGDVAFGSLTSYFGKNFTTAVNNGSIAMARLDDVAQRIMAAYYLLDQDQGYPNVTFDSFRRTGSNNTHVDVRGDHADLIREIGAASIVLLKNTNGTLPLNKPKSIALIGEDMGPALNGPNGFSDRGGLSGTLAVGWGSGTTDFPYLVDPLQAFSVQARQDRSTLTWSFDNADPETAAEQAIGAEVAIVGVASDSGEQYIIVDGNEGDRRELELWHNGTELILATAAVNNNTVVVVHAVGPVILEEWIDHPNVTAVVWAGLPGQESGNGLLDVLYGAYNPSAKLPYTIAKNRSDYSADIDFNSTSSPVVEYTEKLEIDYRHFLAQNITPRFAFGYGLSYTQFKLGNVWIETMENAQEPEYKGRVVGGFLADWLQRPRWKITAEVTNTGGVNGCEVPQLYLEYPAAAGEPPRVLRDFARLNLDPGATKTVEWTLSQYDVSIWDVLSQNWVVPEGDYALVVATSSEDEGVRQSFSPRG